MKLDRNINPNGLGKYALLNLRRVTAIFGSESEHRINEIRDAITLLEDAKILTFGNESPGDQFFVIKHKDRFAHHALKAYADAVFKEAKQVSPVDEALAAELHEFGNEILGEAIKAQKSENRIPD